MALRSQIGNLLLRNPPTRLLLIWLGSFSLGFQLLRRLCGLKSVYPDFESARLACHHSQKCQHTNDRRVKENFAQSVQTRPSDYPALFWLAQISKMQMLRVFDFGGGSGQSFYQYRRLLPEGTIDRWVNMDLPAVIDLARERAQDRPALELEFTTSLNEASHCNVFHTAGAFHYWEKTIEDLAAQSDVLPDHVIINRSPFRENGPTFLAVQSGPGWAVPCKIWSFDELTAAFERIGYRLVAQWLVEQRFRVPLLPAFDSLYRGAYFARRSALAPL